MERIIVKTGKLPVLFVAPHGPDDPNTSLLTEELANYAECYAVINNGWVRADTVDTTISQANCNNTDHVLEDVVQDEFLLPIRKYVTEISKKFGYCDIFMIHGMNLANLNAPPIDMIVGFGDSSTKKPSYSCDLWRKNGFLHLCKKIQMQVYTGAPNGLYSGAASTNLNQLYRKIIPRPFVHSMQLEIARENRIDKKTTKATAVALAQTTLRYIAFVDKFTSSNGKETGLAAGWEKNGENTPTY